MSTYTWTFIKIDALTKQQIERCINHAKDSANSGTYSLPYDKALKTWLDLHHRNYDYFVETCGIPKNQMTDEYLTKKLKKRIKFNKLKLEYYDKVLNGEMDFKDMLRKTHQLNNVDNDFFIIKKNKNYYIDTKYEVFRNTIVSSEEFYTVDSLINWLKQPENCHLMVFNGNDKYEYMNELDPKTEQIIRDYYTTIGDGNFYVHFG